jgi:hypothetical protein
MGSLTPGATYVYERVDDKVYAREVGKIERTLIGYNLPNRRDPLQYDILETQLWQDICEEAKNNPALNDLLEQAKTLYYLTKDYGNSET